MHSQRVDAADVLLEWDAPTTNTDGSVLDDLDGYAIYQRLFTGVFDFTSPLVVVDATQTTYQVTGLGDGHFVWVVRAVDVDGNESESSNEASVAIVLAPNPPTNLRVN